MRPRLTSFLLALIRFGTELVWQRASAAIGETVILLTLSLQLYQNT